MTSAKQMAANQLNAQLSTGPRTDAGKRIARLNATTHGLCGQTVLKTPAEDAAYRTYSDRLMPDLAPGNAIELDFAERIIYDSWRVHRAGVIESNIYALGTNDTDAEFDTGDVEQDDALHQAHTFLVNDKAFNLLSLYEQRLQRSILKNLAALKAMQKERRAQEAEASKAAQQSAAAPKPSLQVVDNPSPSPINGSVYSTPPSDPAPPPAEPSNDTQNMAA